MKSMPLLILPNHVLHLWKTYSLAQVKCSFNSVVHGDTCISHAVLKDNPLHTVWMSKDVLENNNPPEAIKEDHVHCLSISEELV